MINEGKLLEYSEVYGNLYGIPKDFVETQLQQGHDIIFDIDIQGAQKLKIILQNTVVSIFILIFHIKYLFYILNPKFLYLKLYIHCF